MAWLTRPANDFETIAQSPAVKQVQENLRQRQGDIDARLNEWNVWWEHLERQPYHDPWMWFAEGVRARRPHERVVAQARGLIMATHEVVAAAKKALEGSR